jgi:hypothetical protein
VSKIRKKRLAYTTALGVLPGILIANKIPFIH